MNGYLCSSDWAVKVLMMQKINTGNLHLQSFIWTKKKKNELYTILRIMRCWLVYLALTKVPHAFLVRVVQEKIALLDGPVDLEAKTQACILHQVRQDVLS